METHAQLYPYIYSFQASVVKGIGIMENSRAEKNVTGHLFEFYPLTCGPENLNDVPQITCNKNLFSKV